MQTSEQCNAAPMNTQYAGAMDRRFLGPWNHATRTQLDHFKLPEFASPDRQIRLIRMASSPGDEDIACDLVSVDIDNAPPYAAISYTWGDPTPVKLVRMNGHERLLVHHNCWYALWQARLYDKHEYYWLDAICVDQADLDEKSAQVQLMGEIFGNAANVLVSLGTHYDDSIYLLNVAREVYRSKWWRDDEMSSSMQRELKTKWLQAHGFDDPNRPEYQRLDRAWISFCNRPYWHRVWIMQELLLARRFGIVLMCYTETLTLFSLEKLWDEVTVDLVEHAGAAFFMGTPFTKIMQFRGRVDMGPPPLSDSLRFATPGECLDHRDRIYSLLRLSYWPEDAGKPIVPDYTRSTFQLAKEALKYLEQHSLALGHVETLLDALRIDAKSPEMITVMRSRECNRIRSSDDGEPKASHPAPATEPKRCHASIHRGECCRIALTTSGHLTVPLMRASEPPEISRQSSWATSKTYETSEPYKSPDWPSLAHGDSAKPLIGETSIVGAVTSRARAGDTLCTVTGVLGLTACIILRRCRDHLYEIVGQGVLDEKYRIPIAEELSKSGSSLLGSQSAEEVINRGIRLFFDEEDLIAFVAQDRAPTESHEERQRLWLQRPTRSVTKSRLSSYALGMDQTKLDRLSEQDSRKMMDAGQAANEAMEKLTEKFVAMMKSSEG